MKLKGTTLTPEQLAAVETILAGHNCKLEAPAGSGKTFTLLAASRKLRGYGLNVTFNKSVTVKASKIFPQNMLCKTGHALAFGPVGRKYAHRLTKITGASLANSFDLGSPSLFRTAAAKGYQILETIRQFCYSADQTITLHHVPKLQIICKPEVYRDLQENLVYFANKVWTEMADLNALMPITHDVYLKLWALSKPKIKKDFIFFDEAQDANPVILDVIMRQNAQIVLAGDSFQQIYAWRGATNALARSNFQTCYLNKSFRFGQPIADLANEILSSYSSPGLTRPPIEGVEAVNSVVTTDYHELPDCIICRTNAGVIRATIAAQEKSFKVHILGGAFQMINLIRGIQDLKAGSKSFHPELLLFETFSDLVEYTESPMGGDLGYLLKLTKLYGFRDLIKHLNATTAKAEAAEITITTVHKAKGLEWKNIRLGSDFPIPEKGENISQEEANILYVAATRALNVLDISQCDAAKPKAFQTARQNWQELEALNQEKN